MAGAKFNAQSLVYAGSLSTSFSAKDRLGAWDSHAIDAYRSGKINTGCGKSSDLKTKNPLFFKQTATRLI